MRSLHRPAALHSTAVDRARLLAYAAGSSPEYGGRPTSNANILLCVLSTI